MKPANRVVYQTRQIESESEDTEEIKIETGNTTGNFPKWQRLIGDYKITDINDIIDELTGLTIDKPNQQEFKDALKEAKDYQFRLSLQSRQRVTIKKDLNEKQFTTRVQMDYDRKELDEHYRVVDEARVRSTKEKGIKRQERPVQKNFGIKKHLPHLYSLPIKTNNGPEDWLK